jgi:intracellular multiplication protein IcmG
MADDDQLNDEYQFTELDPMNPLGSEETQEAHDVSENKRVAGASNVRRNALFAIGVFFFLIFIYKFIFPHFMDKKPIDKDIKQTASLEQQPNIPEPQSQVIAPPITSTTLPVPESTSEAGSEVNDKIHSIASTQESLSAELSNVSGQVSNINSNITLLTNKISELTVAITTLSDKLEMQAHVIERLTVKPVIPVKKTTIRGIKQQIRYNIQAVIPGRAWIVATNGTTLTVREGSYIPGYGQVKLINAGEGRIITSSGQIIRFSQEDS